MIELRLQLPFDFFFLRELGHPGSHIDDIIAAVSDRRGEMSSGIFVVLLRKGASQVIFGEEETLLVKPHLQSQGVGILLTIRFRVIEVGGRARDLDETTKNFEREVGVDIEQGGLLFMRGGETKNETRVSDVSYDLLNPPDQG